MRIIEAWPSAQALGFWKMRILLGGAEVEVRPNTRGPRRLIAMTSEVLY
jgi:hypothetical protein